MTSPTALHSKKTPKWGTPKEIIEDSRILLDNHIDLDPASSPEFNYLVKADAVFDEQSNGLTQIWAGTVFLNPPGGLVNEFWEKLTESIAEGYVSKAIWIGFSVEQLATLALREYHPLDFSTCILRKRLNFNTEALEPGASPSHSNYLTGLGVDRDLFDKLFSKKGKVVHGLLAVSA